MPECRHTLGFVDKGWDGLTWIFIDSEISKDDTDEMYFFDFCPDCGIKISDKLKSVVMNARYVP